MKTLKSVLLVLVSLAALSACAPQTADWQQQGNPLGEIDGFGPQPT